MLQGMAEMLYTVPGSSEITWNDAGPLNVELYSTTPIDVLQEITLTLYRSGSHVRPCVFCIKTVKDVLLTVVLILGQFGEPVKYTKKNDRNLQHRKYHCSPSSLCSVQKYGYTLLPCQMMCELPYTRNYAIANKWEVYCTHSWNEQSYWWRLCSLEWHSGYT